MIDGSEKHNRQLAFKLQNSHVCEKRSNDTNLYFVFSFFIQQKNHCLVGLFVVVKALAAEGKWKLNKLKTCALSPVEMNI